MAIDLVTFSLANRQFSINSLNLGSISTNGMAILAVKVKYDSKLFRNQREDGSYIVDGRIKLPNTINVDIVVQTKSAADIINRMILDRTTLYTVKTRGLIFNNLTLQNQQIIQNADNISSQPVTLTFKQILSQEQEIIQTIQDADSTTIERGIAYLKETKETVSDLFDKAKKSISGLF